MKAALRNSKEDRMAPSWSTNQKLRNNFYNGIREVKSKHWNNFLGGARGKDVFEALQYTKP